MFTTLDDDSAAKQGTSNSSPLAASQASLGSEKTNETYYRKRVAENALRQDVRPRKKQKVEECPIVSTTEGGALLRQGEVVAFPTETVFGLGADATNGEAVMKIYKAKGRPSDNPLIVHVADFSQITFVKKISPLAKTLADNFWPGPLSIVFEHADGICEKVRAGLNTVAVRMPNHPIALELIRKSGRPIAAPSANISGKPSPTRTDHVIKDLQGKISGVVAGESCSVGLESTVVKLDEKEGKIPNIIILRPGGITKEMIKEVVPSNVEVFYDSHLIKEDQVPLAPGMKYRHYAPDVPLCCIEGTDLFFKQTVESALKDAKKIGVMITRENEFKSFYEEKPEIVVCHLGSRANIAEMSQNLFDCIRTLDTSGATRLFSEVVKDEALGFAFMNRLAKAAGNQIIKEVVSEEN